jgi:nucleotide-binding universal stress UspA family protein
MNVGKILIPLDGSALAEAALQHAIEMVDGATLSLLRAAETDARSASDRAQKVDLIVIATHGRSGLGRLGRGSVAEAVLRGTRVPVLVVRPDGAPVEVPIGGGPAGGDFRV